MTGGRIRVVCATEAFGLIGRERRAFEALYPAARIELSPAGSRAAVGALFSDRADVGIVARELLPEERRAASRGGLELEGYRFARTAILIVVHPSNPVENLALDDLRRIYGGQVTNWSALGGRSERIVPVSQPPESDIAEAFREDALGGEPVRAAVATAAGDSALVAHVARTPGAIGYVSLGTPLAGVRAERLASVTGLPYWKPDLEAIHEGQYPLTRFYNAYLRTAGPRLAHGFVTYVTSRDGQRIVHDAGLVPTSVPVRFVRRSPMMSTHGTRGATQSTP